MNHNLLKEVKHKIQKGLFPSKHEEFGGARLIITSDFSTDYRDEEGLTIVRTEHASAISWLIFQIKKIFSIEIGQVNKYDFYKYIGVTAQSSLERGNDVFEVMEIMLEDVKEYFNQ